MIVATASASTPARRLEQLPNALTIARFLMIPAFVVLLARADGGHDWAAGIVFGVRWKSVV